jgi:hypothetical protein
MKKNELTASRWQPIVDHNVDPISKTPKSEVEDARMFGVFLPVLVFDVNYNLRCGFDGRKNTENLVL